MKQQFLLFPEKSTMTTLDNMDLLKDNTARQVIILNLSQGDPEIKTGKIVTGIEYYDIQPPSLLKSHKGPARESLTHVGERKETEARRAEGRRSRGKAT